MTAEGVVIHKSSNQIRVDTGSGVVLCSLRGRMRGLAGGRSPVVVGDRVTVSRTSDKDGVIECIHPRQSELVRGTAAGKRLVVAANMQQLLAVLSARDPPPRWALVDRLLVTAHRDDLEPAICLNKWDQVESDPERAAELAESLKVYRDLGFPTFTTSALRRQGLEGLQGWLEGRTTVLWGHSGVGKSTLLNALNPELDLREGELSAATGKGRHTTSAVTLLPMPFRGYVADTPGFREFLPVEVAPQDLGRHFPEFLAVLSGCRYRDCLHRTEPACAVRAAVEGGTIAPSRYQHYLQILETLEGGER